jgi:hypothetical protein
MAQKRTPQRAAAGLGMLISLKRQDYCDAAHSFRRILNPRRSENHSVAARALFFTGDFSRSRCKARRDPDRTKQPS